MIKAYVRPCITKANAIEGSEDLYNRSIALVTYIPARLSSDQNRLLNAMLDTGPEVNIIAQPLCLEFNIAFIRGKITSRTFDSDE